MMSPKWKNSLALSLIPQFILVKWFGAYPELVEKYYSEGIYPVIARFLRSLTGWIPFSVGDVMYTLLVFLGFRYLYLNLRHIKQKPFILFRDLAVAISVAFFLFHLYWGMNYYRLPINEKLGFKQEYTPDELTDFTHKLIETTNRLQVQLTSDSLQAVKIPYSVDQIYQKTLVGYETASELHPMFTYEQHNLKSSLYSLALTYMGYGGYLNPFTNEAQVNRRVPKLRLPSISAHEIGHQLGYSSESSTNFIGLLVASVNKDIYFKYAARSHGLAYCLSDLRKKDSTVYKKTIKKVNPGVLKNYQQIRQFWDSYENPTEPIFKSLFNIFLKANNQKKGIKSYNAVVGLMIGYNRISPNTYE